MQFRPLLWPTLFALPALLVLLWLGTWQVQRLEWKNQLIEDFESRATAAPVDLPSGDVGPEMEFRRLALTGSYDHDREVFMTGRTYEGNAGFHIVTPFTLTDGRTVLINRGWVSESYREQDKREFTLVEGEVTVAASSGASGESGDSDLRGRAAHIRYHRASYCGTHRNQPSQLASWICHHLVWHRLRADRCLSCLSSSGRQAALRA